MPSLNTSTLRPVLDRSVAGRVSPAAPAAPTRELAGPQAPTRAADGFDRPLPAPPRDNTARVLAARVSDARRGDGPELLLEMPDANTVPVAAELRDVATRWWVPGAIVPDVLQRTGWFPRAFHQQVVPEQIGPNTYRVRVERSWFARLCGAQLQADAGVNWVRVMRTTASGTEHANINLAPDARRTTGSFTCALPPGATGTEYNPVICTAPMASGRGASSTVRLEWPR
ncbi:MAG: hypothetical protein FJ137_05800 [Deltaproteobacteria bacterium]|nr:hypothetical protein [Deltaproteobacteria bacterium]